MKKCLIILLISLSFLVTGCDNEKKQKEQLKTAATAYYNAHMSGIIGLNKAEVTLEMLKEGNKIDKQKYEISSLEKCDKTTKIIFTLENHEIVKEEYKLVCEKK